MAERRVSSPAETSFKVNAKARGGGAPQELKIAASLRGFDHAEREFLSGHR